MHHGNIKIDTYKQSSINVVRNNWYFVPLRLANILIYWTQGQNQHIAKPTDSKAT